MQRAITDFGADHAFGLVPKKLQEHYGISLFSSTVRAITEYHAGQIYQAEEGITDQPKTDGCKLLIGEIDACRERSRTGSMIPIVTIDEAAEDKRKNKTLQWPVGFEMVRLTDTSCPGVVPTEIEVRSNAADGAPMLRLS